MTFKKALAVLMVAVMLVVPFSVVSIAAGNYAIVLGPDKTNYTDNEHFVAQGIVISDGTEIIAYSPTDDKWAFNPELNELLNVGIDADGNDSPEQYVEVYYDNKYVGTVTVYVEHVLGDIVFVGQTGHGQYCLGCGKLHNFEPHSVPEFIPNDDGGLIVQQTQTGTCDICKGQVTENIPGSEKFGNVFNPETMTETEAEIVGYIYNILISLIQMLVGIK